MITLLLLKAGADPNAHDDDKRTPLHMAIGRTDPVKINLLLQYGAQVHKTMLEEIAYTIQRAEINHHPVEMLKRIKEILYAAFSQQSQLQPEIVIKPEVTIDNNELPVEQNNDIGCCIC